MNDLWERYVAKLARRLRLDGVTVHTQDSKPFWRADAAPRTLRPDLTLRDALTDEVLLLVDTKWKVPPGGRAASADLKQMFCYHELFTCPRSMLLYPSTTGATHIAERGRYADRAHTCTLAFLDVDGDVPAELRRLLGSHSSTGPQDFARRSLP